MWRTWGDEEVIDDARPAHHSLWMSNEDELDPELIGAAHGYRFKRNEERVDRDRARMEAAHVAEEIAQRLHALAVRLRYAPGPGIEKTIATVRAHDAVEPARARTPYRPAQTNANRAWTLEEFRDGWIKPLGSGAFAWTQVFNRAEFREDREAMLATTRALAAIRRAFWPEDLAKPDERPARSTKFLEDIGKLSRTFLGDDDVVYRRPDIARDLLDEFTEEMRRPFFVWSSASANQGGQRKQPTEEDLAATAERLTRHLLESIRDGYGLTEIKADLPPEFDGKPQADAARSVILDGLRHFEAGIDLDDQGQAVEGARRTVRAALRALGYPADRAKTLFDPKLRI